MSHWVLLSGGTECLHTKPWGRTTALYPRRGKRFLNSIILILFTIAKKYPRFTRVQHTKCVTHWSWCTYKTGPLSPQNAHHLKGKPPAGQLLVPPPPVFFSPPQGQEWKPGLHIYYVSTLPMGHTFYSGGPGSYSAAQHGPGLVLANVLHKALLLPACSC